MKDLRGKNTLVTGAAMGMGKSLSRLLLLEGARVAIVDIREEALEAVREELDKLGDVAAYRCDISDRQGVYDMASKVKEEFGAI
ncbi:MAG: SDR family oxidoreductase, partial [Actinobacteria bacterium]|nr:SDR family oxidoreductase [Actinomycetota bacterium]